MSKPYDEYLKGHIANVKQGYQWLCSHFEDVRKKMQGGPDEWDYLFEIHDESKYDVFEYEAYDDYFYGGNKSYKVVKAFKRAWLHHIHHNPHHWQFWVLLNDDEGEECLEMPYPHVIEMICDWWSFSWKKGDLTEIFRWYEEHRAKMKLHEDTRKLVEDILKRMAGELGVTFNGTIEHHGIKGQKWGVRNGPPYPLNSEKVAKHIYAEAQDHIKEIEADVSRAAKKAGSELYGLEHKLKTEESINRKILKNSHEDEESLTKAANDIKDVIRFTTISSEDDYVRSYNVFKQEMENLGYTETRCKNYFDLFNKGVVKHKSVQSSFAAKDGYIFEVQFHTKASQDAKNKKLPLYNERRQEGISKSRAMELERMMEDLALAVKDPHGIETIKSHKEDQS